MVHRNHVNLSRRERQIMDVLYAEDEATAAEVHQKIPESPSYSAVRALLKKLLDKGHASYRQEGPRYVYTAVVGKAEARQGAVTRLLNTFFSGSAKDAVVSLLGRGGDSLTDSDIEAIEAELRALKRQRDDTQRGRK